MTEIVVNKPPIIPLVCWPGAPSVYVPREDEASAVALLKGERGLLPEHGEPDVRRILDLCPGAGEFSVWCRMRFPAAWVDMIASEEDEARLCRINAAPGARVFQVVDLTPTVIRYDLIRTDETENIEHLVEIMHAQLLFLDGAVIGALPEFALAAQGMYGIRRGYQWWVRSRVPT